VLQRVVVAGGRFTSFKVAAEVFKWLTDLVITDRTVRNKTVAIGGELAKSRVEMTDVHSARPVVQEPKIAQPAVSLVAVQVDGGPSKPQGLMGVGAWTSICCPHPRKVQPNDTQVLVRRRSFDRRGGTKN
jgi:hypothetical protein